MWNFLEKLRALPEGSRKIVTLFSSASITAILLISWLVFPVPHFGALSNAEKERKSADSLITPFSVIGGEIHQATGGIKDKWDSFGGAAGVASVISGLKGTGQEENASSTTATSADASLLEAAQNKKILSGQEAFLRDTTASSSDAEATTTATITE